MLVCIVIEDLRRQEYWIPSICSRLDDCSISNHKRTISGQLSRSVRLAAIEVQQSALERLRCTRVDVQSLQRVYSTHDHLKDRYKRLNKDIVKDIEACRPSSCA